MTSLATAIRQVKRYRIDVTEIEFVSRHPRDHGYVYVKAVREACYRRYGRASGKAKADLKATLKRLDAALMEWPIVLEGGKAVVYAPNMIRDQESGFLHERFGVES